MIIKKKVEWEFEINIDDTIEECCGACDYRDYMNCPDYCELLQTNLSSHMTKNGESSSRFIRHPECIEKFGIKNDKNKRF